MECKGRIFTDEQVANLQHCCIINSKPCEFLTRVDGLLTCSIRADYDSWEAMRDDPRYQYVKDRLNGNDCITWPKATGCNACGAGK